MGSVIDCFMLEPSDQQVVYLRRYAGSKVRCGSTRVGYHQAQVELERGSYQDEASGDLHAHDDPRWPTACQCGRVFEDGDAWQRAVQQLYRRSDTGELITLHEPPPGAMWYAPWHEDHFKGPDGRCLVVVTPGGEWIADAPSSSGDGWERHGVPPMVTATPSIAQMDVGKGKGAYKYHGHLTNGQLVEC